MSGVEQHYTISGAIIIGLTLIAGAIRWSAGKFTKSHDRSIVALVENAKIGATITANFNTLVGRFDYLAARFNDVVEIFLMDSRISDSQRAKLAQKTSRAETSRAATLKIPIVRDGDNAR